MWNHRRTFKSARAIFKLIKILGINLSEHCLSGDKLTDQQMNNLAQEAQTDCTFM